MDKKLIDHILQIDELAKKNVAEIEEKNFLGSSVRYKAKIQNGMTVECETHPDNAFAEIGDAVKLYLDKDKIVLMGGT